MLKKLVCIALTTLSVACSDIQFANDLSATIPEINVANMDTNDKFTHLLVIKLEQNGIHVVKHKPHVPILNINRISNSQTVVSLFETGSKAEDEIHMSIQASLIRSNQDIKPIEVKLVRTFFDNPRSALAKSIEKQQFIEEMYEHIIDQLIVKMVYAAQK